MNKKDKTLAGILSFFLPGLGQIYAGKTWRGIFFFIAVVIGYMLFVIPGIIIWIVSIWDAVKMVEGQGK